MNELEQLKRDNEVLYRDNVTLSETADRLREALAADDQASHIIEWKSRAEAAEAARNMYAEESVKFQDEAKRLREACECLIIGACSVAVPNPRELDVLKDAVAMARKLMEVEK